MAQLNITSSYGGLNLADPLDNMGQEFAIQMDNIIPDPNGDKVRSGYILRKSGVFSCLLPIPTNGTERVFASKSDTIYIYDPDNWATAPTTKGNFTSDEWMNTQFTDGSGAVHTFFANGQDTPQDFSSGTLSDSTFTIPTGVKLDCPLSFKNRLYFVGGDFTIYYGGVQSISGALTAFSVGSYFKKGGKILAITNWTQDAGQGLNDLFVIISTEGEVMIYSGTSPEADDWQTLGVFQIPRPVGKYCAEMVGADVVIITEQGYLPLSMVLSDLRANRTAISGKINPIVRDKNFTERWEIHFFSKRGWLFINAPSSVPRYSHEQHVLNIATNSWCRFVGMDGQSWCVLNDKLYFCNGTGIYQADTGTTDNGNWITFKVQKAYNQFGTPLKKQVIRMVPRFSTYAENTIEKCINADFKTGKNRKIIVQDNYGYASYWDTAIWDENYWSDEYEEYQTRAGVQSRTGSFISIGINGRTKQELSFYSTGLILKVGSGHI